MRHGIAFLCLALLTACAATGPRYTDLQALPDSGQARIYFLRESAIYASGQFARVWVDGQRIGSLASGGYLMADVPQGHHIVTVNDWWGSADSKADFTIAAGAVFYIGVSAGPPPPLNEEELGRAKGVTNPFTENRGFWKLQFLPPILAQSTLRSLALSE